MIPVIELTAQEKQPKLVEFGAEPYERPFNTVEPPEVIETEETLSDTSFVITLQELSQYYQSTRLVIALTNKSGQYVDNFWVQVRLLDQNGSFLYREQPVLFTTLESGRTHRAEMLCESIGKDEVGYVVFRLELLELDREELPFESRYIQFKSDVKQPVKLVLSTMFE